MKNAGMNLESCILCLESKEKTCISAGILKLMARFELATSSLPNGAEILISSPKTEQKIDIKWQYRVELWEKLKKCKIHASWHKIYKTVTQSSEM